MKWEVHYDDDTFVSDEHTTPIGIERRRDVQVIIQEDTEHKWVTLSGYDYYMFDVRHGTPQWFGGDWSGLVLYLLTPGSKAVLLGSHIDKYRFREIMQMATKRLGAKQGYNAAERQP